MTDRKNQLREIKEAIEYGQEKLFEALSYFKFAVKELDDLDGHSGRYAECYLVDHLEIRASSDHGFLSNDLNCDQWVENIDQTEKEYQDMLDDEKEESEPEYF